MPKISIIVPVYNVEEYLRPCIDSILSQTFTDFELILVDDGSPDNCGAICDEYGLNDERVHVIHQQNAGLSAARNKGISVSAGDYICFVDSDDLISKEFCNILYKTICSTASMMAACRIFRFDGDKPSIENSRLEEKAPKMMNYAVFLYKQMDHEIEVGVCNRLYKRSIFDKLCFRERILHEDICFAGDLLTLDLQTVAYVDIPLYYYRQRGDSIVNKQVLQHKCSPDRILSAAYLLHRAEETHYPYFEKCLSYAICYPWSFLDPVYVDFRFRENKAFMNELQKLIVEYREQYKTLSTLSEIQKRRIVLFSYSKFLYGFNAYARLLRVYLYHIINRDPYADGHGI